MTKFTHLGDKSGIQMVDVSKKPSSSRYAVAEAVIELGADAYTALVQQRTAKGDVLTTAQLAGIMGAKQTARLIPLCHQVSLDAVDIEFELNEETHSGTIQASVTSCGRTGVEMEALTAVTIASLAVYDMCKSISKAIRITDIRLISKDGGVHGSYRVQEDPQNPLD